MPLNQTPKQKRTKEKKKKRKKEKKNTKHKTNELHIISISEPLSLLFKQKLA